MPYPFQVLREIPSHLLHGINNGTYSLHGGVVRDVQGRIVAHLLSSNKLHSNADVLSQLPNQLATLQASVLLQGINLIVNVVGFAIVCQKLNQVSEQLDKISDQVEKIHANQQFSEARKSIEIRAHIAADLKNVERGLRINDTSGVSDARNNLNRIVEYHINVTNLLLEDTQAVYQNMSMIGEYIDMSIIGNIAIARSYAHQGYLDEWVGVLGEMEDWHKA